MNDQNGKQPTRREKRALELIKILYPFPPQAYNLDVFYGEMPVEPHGERGWHVIWTISNDGVEKHFHKRIANSLADIEKCFSKIGHLYF